MKKLMIAAASAAMVTGAFADDSAVCKGCGGGYYITTPEIEYEIETINQIPGHIWDITLKATTLVKKCMTCKSDCVSCGDENKVSYYDTGKRTFTGVAWTCYEPCRNYANGAYDEYTGDDIQEKDNEATDSANVLMWDASKKIAYGHIQRYLQTKTTTDNKVYYYSWGTLCDDVVATTLVGLGDDNDAFRFGKTAQKASWSLSYIGTSTCTDEEDDYTQTLNFGAVAFGSIKTYKNKGYEDYLVIDKATGGAVGSVTACVCDEFGLVIPVCYEGFESWCDDGEELAETPFYGTITVKYNASKSKQLRTTARFLVTPGKVFPKYCFTDEVIDVE